MELANEVAAELAGSQDAVLRALEDHLECRVYLRGNLLTLEGEDAEVKMAERVVNEIAELITRGHQIAPGTVTAVMRALAANESPAEVLEDVIWRHRALRVAPKTVNQKRYIDGLPPRRPDGQGRSVPAPAL
jgi:phosphate starvation-inducible PhoH-like protein